MLPNTTLVKAFSGLRTERTPLWFMRQAGRYLPEYREIRKKHSMLEVIQTPELAAEVTLQPLRRFDLDAAIIFADILNPLIGMGVQLDFVEGEGPKIFNPIKTNADVERLVQPELQTSIGYTLRAIERCVEWLTPRKVPLIGFAGAPFTLACYMISGTSHDEFRAAREFALREPSGWKLLQEKLVAMVADYLALQVRAGASVVQLFDSWAGLLSPAEYGATVLPYLKQLLARFRKQSDAPFCYFATGAAGLYSTIAELGADVVGVDWRISLPQAQGLLGKPCVMQGNLDPVLLASATPALIEQHVRRILEEGRELKAHVFNLGHGILPHTPIENVERVVHVVRNWAA